MIQNCDDQSEIIVFIYPLKKRHFEEKTMNSGEIVVGVL